MEKQNIYIFETNKPSKIIGATIYSLELLSEVNDESMSAWNVNKNIYITFKENFKVGGYFLPKGHLHPHKLKEFNKVSGDLESENGLCYDITKCDAIVLTTDEDLIKDGVQAIDDKVLEWIIKNPTCKFAKVEKVVKDISTRVSDDIKYPNLEVVFYEVEIPKKIDFNQIIKDMPDFSFLSREEKEKVLSEFLQESGKYFLAYVKMFGLKSHIECGIVNENNVNEKYRLMFRTEEYHLAQSRFSLEQVELIANEMVNWAIDNIGNSNLESGKKFDEVINKYKV